VVAQAEHLLRDFVMSRKKKWKILALGVSAVACVTLLFSCRHSSDPPDGSGRLLTLEGHHFPVQALAFSPDGTTVTSAAFPSTGQGSELEVAVWRAATGKRMTQQTAPLHDVLWLCLAPGGQTLAAVGKDRNLWLGNLSTATWRRLGENPGHVVALAFSEPAFWPQRIPGTS
jgi:WD40 repeat protein